MPFKSKAQRRKFAQLLVDGEITPEVFEEWNRETGRATLPERVKKKSRARSGPKTKRKSSRSVAKRGVKARKPARRATARKKGTGTQRSATRR
jgi:hypothetical protein